MKTRTSLVSMIILAAALSGCCYITPFATPEGNQKMPKTLVFNFDGTGDEPDDVKKSAEDKGISNIYKLHLLLGGGTPDVTTPDGGEQYTFYYKGIGTSRFVLWRLLNEGFGPPWGDAQRILRAACRDFARNYKKDDRVVIFGFSRGAALARMFISKILKKDKNIDVAFLGVFDTVVEIGSLKRRNAEYLGEPGTLDERVQRAVHIVALDEDRITFRPTLINKDQPPNLDRILELWFPGIHTDIGGSHPDDGLGDLALDFMIRNFRKAMDDGNAIRITPGDPESVEALLKDLKGSDPAQYQDIQADKIMICPKVSGTLHKNNQGWITLLEEEGKGPVFRNVRVNDNDQRDPNEYPLIHYSVKKRFGLVLDPEYRPPALRGVDFKLYQANGRPSVSIYKIREILTKELTEPPQEPATTRTEP